MDDDHHQQAFLHFYTSTCCDANDRLADRSNHILATHLTDVLGSLRQAFARHQHPALDTRQTRYADPRIDSEHLENQTWKETQHGYDQVNVIEWIVNTCPGEKLGAALPQMIPATLLILDDYDVSYKVRGANIIRQLVAKLDSKLLIRSSIDNALFHCLTYLSQENDVQLLNAAYPCLLDLIDKTKASGSKERVQLYERVMVNGVILGFQSAATKTRHLEALLRPVSRLYMELGPLGVYYLKPTIGAIAEALGMSIYELNKIALESLQTVMHTCWPRITRFKGVILKGLATCWLHYSKGESSSDKEMRHTLQDTFRLFQACTQDAAKDDIDALLQYDQESFSALFGNTQQ
ncbi:hypothetical protein O0I10_000725 [Lichtheimia ornata]|uniref:Uncharacterized protein n=1 Tax=Lichtheimia ornata TaxID=688661 RepID=A0AAD8DJ41_9FUNG|nr:uncharacterized protein O0I10_000725 [Lichtheimia ornata]KAJ8663483.1 hypothetical protein O0I10_000725 [Lichtheimia ornata]